MGLIQIEERDSRRMLPLTAFAFWPLTLCSLNVILQLIFAIGLPGPSTNVVIVCHQLSSETSSADARYLGSRLDHPILPCA